MEPENLLPDHDRDLQLARKIAQYRSVREFSEEIEDPLLSLLIQYQNADNAELNRQSPNSDAMWANIEAGLQTEKTPVYQLSSRSDVIRWIAAAAVVIIALTTFYWLFDSRQPDLLAETGTDISSVTLNDGSTVTLRPYSSLHEVSYSSEEQVYMISGEAYFEVKNNPEREFIAETNDGRVIVLGTKFVVQNWNDKTSVFLEEGRVRFETIDETDYTLLEPGEYSTISDGEIAEPIRENSRVYKDWLENILVLENQQVRAVFSEIEQHFNVSIDGTNAPGETLGGSIQLDNLEQVLDDLAVVLGGAFERTDENRYEYIPGN